MAKPCGVGSAVLSDNTDGRGNHIVQFYEVTDELIDGVGAYVLGALSIGDVAIVVATVEHRAQLDRLLVDRGVDVVATRARGLLVERDADEVLARFTGPDGLSRADFEAAIIELIAPAAREGRAVRIFGEIVAVLWDRGLVAQALELEGFWNDLQDTLSFELYCAYPSSAVSDDVDRDDLATVCELHSALHGAAWPTCDSVAVPAHVVRFFDSSLRAASAARQLVRAVLSARYDDDLVEDGELVICELVANAVLHTGRPFTVDLWRTTNGVRLTVTDLSPAAPHLLANSCDATSGRGLSIVAAVATRWGYDITPTGKTIWAELNERGPQP